ncbi:MAG: TIGR03088 family PEP-CTERM/XrtA system glycosyltransferase [Pseudomonadota bacterium]
MTDQSSRRLTIAHVVFRFDYGGMENGIVNVINHTDSRRYRHVVIALSEVTDFAQRITADDVECIALHKRPGKDLPMYGRLMRVLRRVRPDIYHSRNIGTIDTVPFARLAGVPVCIHGEHGWDVHDPDGTNPKYRWMRKITGVFIHAFMTVSRQLRDWMVGVVGIAPEKLHHICNGVDTERFKPVDKAAARSGLLPADVFPADAIVIGSVGRMEAIKDPLNLIDAFVALAEQDPEDQQRLRLLYVGNGALFQTVEQRVAESGFADRVWLAGSRDDVPALLPCMDVFALPSLREGISNTILEAMACGVPVVATDTGGNPELVTDGKTGALVPVGDSAALAAALSRYVHDGDYRQSHSVAARDDAEKRLSLATMINHYEALYDAAAKQ